MTPELALKRGGHKHPEQIIEDLTREGFTVVTDDYIEEVSELAYERGYEDGL